MKYMEMEITRVKVVFGKHPGSVGGIRVRGLDGKPYSAKYGKTLDIGKDLSEKDAEYLLRLGRVEPVNPKESKGGPAGKD